MNNINITVNLSQEDRLRIDKLNTNLTILKAALGAVIGHLEGVNAANEKKGLIQTEVVEEVIHVPGPTSFPHIPVLNIPEKPIADAQQAQEAPQEVVEEQTPTTTENAQNEPQEVETATPAPTVTKQDILQKVIALCGKGKKAEAKDIITTYADSVSDLPDSALTEVWDKLTALEM